MKCTFCTGCLHRNSIVEPGLAFVMMMLIEYADQHGVTYCWHSSFRRETADLHGVVVGRQHSHTVEAGAHGGGAGRKPGRADQRSPLHGCQHAWIHIHCHCALSTPPLRPLDCSHKGSCFIPLHLQLHVTWHPTLLFQGHRHSQQHS